MKRFFVGILAVLLISSCTDDFNLGLNVLPDDDYINLEVTDTITIIGTTELSDHVKTSNSTKLLIGRYEDNFFGTTTAGFVAQLILLDYPGFPDDIVLDSVCLCMPLAFDDNDHYYGDPFSPVHVKVYRITDSLDKYQSYYSDHEMNTTDYTLIGNSVLIYDLPDSCLMLRLNDDWGQYLIDNEDELFYGYGTYFHEIVRGIYLEPYSGNGAIFKVDASKSPLQTDFKMKLYYHRESQPDTQYIFDGIQVNSSSVKFNLYSHDYSGTPLQEQLNNPQNLQNTEVYLQGMAGTMVKFEFPYIKKLKDKNILINKAELLLKIDNNTIGNLPPIDQIVMMAKDTADNEVFFEDFIEPTSSAYMGADLENYTEYKLNVTRIVQNMIEGNYDYLTYYFVDRNASVDYKRSVLTTSLHPESPMKLVIFYTQLPENN